MDRRAIGRTLVTLLLVLPGVAAAVCNVIPVAGQPFRGTAGSVDRPFVAPGDWIELGAEACTLPAGFERPERLTITVVFRPPRDGRPTVLVLTPEDCATTSVAERLAACGAAPEANVVCRTLRTAGSLRDVETPRARPEGLRFRFPDTDELVGAANDDATLTGPITIAVTRRGDPFPCALARQRCEVRAGLIGCVDRLLAPGTCADTPDPIFRELVALPPPNDFAALCTTPAFPVGPCTGLQDDMRLTIDADGNLLVPVDWSGILVRRDQVPVARLLRAATATPAFPGAPQPIRFPDAGFLESFSPEGSRLPPLFEQQRVPGAGDRLTLFGSADAAYGVLRFARRSVRGLCSGGARTCGADAECPAGESCRRFRACAGGTADGLPCNAGVGGECEDGGGVCGATRCLTCASGVRQGAPCREALDCPGEVAGVFGACTPGGDVCGHDGECGSGGECGPPLFDFTTRLADGVGPIQIDDLEAQALDPVPLAGLVPGDGANAFVFEEAIHDEDLNGDGDQTDPVVVLQDGRTGVLEHLGGGERRGPAVARVRDGSFRFPAVALEGGVLAVASPEALDGGVDTTANGSLLDAVLHVFRLGAGSLLSPGAVVPVDPSPQVDGRSVVVSAGQVFFRSPAVASRPVVVERASRRHDGGALDGHSLGPAVSADGRVVAFTTLASNVDGPADPDCVTAGSFACQHVVVHDRVTGTLVRASARPDGTPGNGPSMSPALSANGRVVAFVSAADDLLADGSDRNGAQDVFVHDLDAGTIERVSVATGGVEVAWFATNPSLSADGRFVAFESTSPGFAPGDDDQASDVFVHDRATRETVRVSAFFDGGTADGFDVEASEAMISGDGRFVAFVVREHVDSSIVVADRVTGEVELVSVAARGAPVLAAAFAASPSISHDGRFVGFHSVDPLVPGDTNDTYDVFVRDRLVGATVRASVDSDGSQAAEKSTHASISGDGRYVAFQRDAPGTVSGTRLSLFVHDLLTGVTERITSAADGGEPDSASVFVQLSRDGRTSVFQTFATNLGVPDENGVYDVIVKGPAAGDDGGAALARIDTTTSGAPPVEALGRAGAVAIHAGDAVFLQPDGDAGAVMLAPLGQPARPLGKRARAIALSDRFAAALEAVGDALRVATYDRAAETWNAFDVPAASLALRHDVGAFTTPAGLLHVFDAATHGMLVGAGATVAAPPVADYVAGGRAGEEIVAARRASSDDAGLELLVYDRASSTMIATGRLARACHLEACDPRVPYRVGNDTVTFLAFEGDERRDLNGDDDANDLVLQVMNVRLAATGAPVGRTSRVLAAAPAGVCTTTGRACAADADCGQGRCFVPPGGCLVPLEDESCELGSERQCADFGGFCMPSRERGEGTCHVRLTATCASDDECRAREPDADPLAFCSEGDQALYRLADPLAPRDGAQPGGAAFAGAGRCVEDLGVTCDPSARRGAPGACRRGAACEPVDGDPTVGRCHREQRSCRADDDCAGNAVCRKELVTNTVADADGDELPDPIDNCPGVANLLQEDADDDGVGDACDPSSACEAMASVPSVRCRLVALIDLVHDDVSPGTLRTSLVRAAERARGALLRLEWPGVSVRTMLRRADTRLRGFDRRLRALRARRTLDPAVRLRLREAGQSLRDDLRLLSR